MSTDAGIMLNNFIILAIRMMPIFICLKPKYGSRENIAAISVYLWVVMISLQSILHMKPSSFAWFQAVFSFLFFIILLIFFEGRIIQKAFMYVSTWLLSSLSVSLNLLFSRLIVLPHHPISPTTIRLLVSTLIFWGYFFYVLIYLKKRLDMIFHHISYQNSTLLLAVPLFFIMILNFGNRTIFSPTALLQGQIESIIFYFILTSATFILYTILINNLYSIIAMQEAKSQLELAKKLIEQQKSHYNKSLEYLEQIRVIKHDFHHHIHALLNMTKEEQTAYLRKLDIEFQSISNLIYCNNPALNSLLQDFAHKAERHSISFNAKLSLPSALSIDDLTLCIIIGNLLTNAYEACSKVAKPYINIRGKWQDGYLYIMVENSFNGMIKTKGSTLISLKHSGGLGHLSIRRLLNPKFDDFSIDYTEDTFLAMIKIKDRTGNL